MLSAKDYSFLVFWKLHRQNTMKLNKFSDLVNILIILGDTFIALTITAIIRTQE